MKERIATIYKEHKDIILYLFYGILTTLVNILVFTLSVRLLSLSVIISNIIAWICSVLFAYITNRKFVFRSSVSGSTGIFKEICAFFSGRLFTGILDAILMYLLVDVLLFDDVLMKIAVNIIVVVLNYIISKLFVFKRDKND